MAEIPVTKNNKPDMCVVQMVYFQTKNTKCGIFWKALEWEILVYFMHFWNFLSCLLNCIAVWYILWSFGIFLPFWYVVPRKIWQPWYSLHKHVAGSHKSRRQKLFPDFWQETDSPVFVVTKSGRILGERKELDQVQILPNAISQFTRCKPILPTYIIQKIGLKLFVNLQLIFSNRPHPQIGGRSAKSFPELAAEAMGETKPEEDPNRKLSRGERIAKRIDRVSKLDRFSLK
jgi:hypothetical protein